MATVYACLVVRSYFQAGAESELAYSGVMLSRAALCELMAMKLLNHFASNRMQLVAVLTTSWSPLAGATPDIIEEVKHALGGHDDDLNYPQSALEVFEKFLVPDARSETKSRWAFQLKPSSSWPVLYHRKSSMICTTAA